MITNTYYKWTRTVCACAISVTAVTHVRADYPSAVLAKSPVYYWRLNDKPTVPAADKASNLGSLGAQSDGYYVGTASHPVAGALAAGSDTAASVDATAGSAINIPYSSALNPATAFTVEAWLQPNADTTTANPTCALSSGAFSDPRSGWLLYQIDTGWSFRMYNQNGTATAVNISGGGAPAVGSWYHVVATYDGTTATLYVNGTVAGTGTPPSYVPSAGGSMFIGGRSDSSFWWNGQADEVAVYGKALTATEINDHYKNGTSAAPTTPYQQLVLAGQPLVYYRLNEPAYTAPTTLPVAKNAGTGGAAGDGSFNPGVDGTAAGPQLPIYAGFGADNTGLGLNGLAGYVGTPATLNDLPAFTVIGWMKRGTSHSLRGGYFGQNDLLEFGDADSGANIEAWINAYNTNIKIPFPFKDNEWGMIALVGSATGSTLYTNGLAAATVNQAVDSFGSSTYFFNIGGGGVFNGSGDYFLGNIDEVAVFDKALTADDIQALFFAANIAPVIATQPVAPDRDVYEGNTVTLSVAATGTPPLRYQWRKGGNDLSGKTTAELSFASITTGDAGAYDVVVSNDYGSVTSSNVTLVVKPADNVPPAVQYAAGTKSLTGVRIWFSESLSQASAETVANYSISDGLTITAAKLAAAPGQPGDNIVELTTAAQTAGKTYTVTINNVRDQSSPGNSIAAGSTVTFSAWVLAQGYLTFEHYDKISGAADSDITKGLADPRVVAGTPTTAGHIKGKFDSRTIFPDDSHENYLARVTGWITPKESGEYQFFLNSDDASRLYLSVDDKLPDLATATPIAVETDCCDAFQEPGTANDDGSTYPTSDPVNLVAGRRYGMVALIKEGGGGDYLRVAWRKTSDSTAAASLPYLPGEFFATYVDPNVDVTITQQPTDQPGVVPSPIVEFAAANFATSDGGFTASFTDKEVTGPFVHDASNGQWSADGGESGCTGPYNSLLNSPAYTVPESDEVTLTFSHRYSFEGDLWDGGQVRISVNGGDFATVPAENFTANGYASGKIQGNGILKDQPAFNGDSAGYASGTLITSSAILGSFKKGDKIVVQFAGAWDDCTTASVPGWVVKNVQLAYGTAARSSTFTAEATATQQGKPVAFSYQWQRNDGTGFVDIADATSASYRIFPTLADFSAQFRVVAGVPGKGVPSNAVKLVKGGTTTPEISISRSGANLSVVFTGKLQVGATVNGPFTDVPGATSPYVVPTTAGSSFYRSAQ
ncbi:MAG: immunoglobulin domain-containing protein [Verrucomicrobiales bacterium]|nr:immunoglobulin domain-containing protein [Verrucomicrobiales bacterium]